MFRLMVALLIAGLFISCSVADQNKEDDYLIRVGDRVVTVADFHKAFEIAKAAYPHNLIQKPKDFHQAQVRVLNQLTEELILLERAEELNIEVSDEEVEKSVAEIKKDYPDDVFEETLLEYAVSYQSWKQGLRTRLLMEKLIEHELKNQIVITPDEIAKYYKENYNQEESQPGTSGDHKDIDAAIIRHLRREKTEKAYRTWIETIQQHYTIEINKDQWKKILAS